MFRTAFANGALICAIALTGCMETTPEEDPSTVSGTDARKAEPACAQAVSQKTGVSRDDLFGANTQVTSNGARVEVYRIGDPSPWICTIDTSGAVLSVNR